MRFTAEAGWAIVRGEKRTHRTRKPHKAGETHPLHFPQVVTDSYGQDVYRDQQKVTKLATDGLLIIDAVREERLDAIVDNPKALKAEGWTTLYDFAREWMIHFDYDPVMRRALKEGRIDAENVIPHWQERHGHKTVYVLALRLEYPDRPRLLARDGHDSYTASNAMALDHEPEAVDVTTVNQFVKDNWRRFAEGKDDQRARQELNRLGRTVREEGIRAIRSGLDVSAELTNIQRELDAIRDKRAA